MSDKPKIILSKDYTIKGVRVKPMVWAIRRRKFWRFLSGKWGRIILMITIMLIFFTLFLLAKTPAVAYAQDEYIPPYYEVGAYEDDGTLHIVFTFKCYEDYSLTIGYLNVMLVNNTWVVDEVVDVMPCDDKTVCEVGNGIDIFADNVLFLLNR